MAEVRLGRVLSCVSREHVRSVYGESINSRLPLDYDYAKRVFELRLVCDLVAVMARRD
jgi:hypothetical protein